MNYEKIDKFIEIREVARKRLHATDLQIQKEKEVCSILFRTKCSVLGKAQDMDYDRGEQHLIRDFEDTFYLQRLDGGLFMLQSVDYILAWAVMEDDGVRHCLAVY